MWTSIIISSSAVLDLKTWCLGSSLDCLSLSHSQFTYRYSQIRRLYRVISLLFASTHWKSSLWRNVSLVYIHRVTSRNWEEKNRHLDGDLARTGCKARTGQRKARWPWQEEGEWKMSLEMREGRVSLQLSFPVRKNPFIIFASLCHGSLWEWGRLW